MAYKHFKPGDIVSATLEKLDDENDDAGLRMEVRHGRVFIYAVEGLFRERFESRGLPILPGDQLLEFNGKEYKEYRNLKEIIKVHDEQARIWLKVLRTNPDDPSQSTDSEWEPEESEEEEEEEELLCLENGPGIQPGDIMMIQGLTNKPEFNGETVEVLREVKGKAGRWQVKGKESGKIVAVPAENLVPVEEEEYVIQPGAIMMLQGLTNKPEYNGEKVEVLREVKGKAGKWQVKVIKTGKIMSVAADNLVPIEEEEEEEEEEALLLENGPSIQPGATMILQGLDKKPELNGETVEVLREVKGKPGKWQVKVHETGKIIVVSEHNLVPAEEESEEEEEEEVLALENGRSAAVIEPGEKMELHGLDKKPELNGEVVDVLRQVKGKQGKWQVKVRETGKIIVVSSENLS
jgi:hypothetical protein